MISRILSLVIFLGLFSLSAQAASLYRTEVILVAYKNETSLNNEHWPKYLAEPTSATVKSQTSASLNTASSTNAPLSLQEEVRRINQMRDMKVIWHQAWVENLEENASPILHSINVNLTDKVAMSLTGTISVSRSRYLHFNSDLIMQHSKLHSSPANLENTQADPTGTEMDANSPYIRAAQIKLSRKMRSGELHYLDHPMLGIIVKVVPVK